MTKQLLTETLVRNYARGHALNLDALHEYQCTGLGAAAQGLKQLASRWSGYTLAVKQLADDLGVDSAVLARTVATDVVALMDGRKTGTKVAPDMVAQEIDAKRLARLILAAME